MAAGGHAGIASRCSEIYAKYIEHYVDTWDHDVKSHLNLSWGLPPKTQHVGPGW